MCLNTECCFKIARWLAGFVKKSDYCPPSMYFSNSQKYRINPMQGFCRHIKNTKPPDLVFFNKTGQFLPAGSLCCLWQQHGFYAPVFFGIENAVGFGALLQ